MASAAAASQKSRTVGAATRTTSATWRIAPGKSTSTAPTITKSNDEGVRSTVRAGTAAVEWVTPAQRDLHVLNASAAPTATADNWRISLTNTHALPVPPPSSASVTTKKLIGALRSLTVPVSSAPARASAALPRKANPMYSTLTTSTRSNPSIASPVSLFDGQPNVYAQLLQLSSPDSRAVLERHARTLAALEGSLQAEIRQLDATHPLPRAAALSEAEVRRRAMEQVAAQFRRAAATAGMAHVDPEDGVLLFDPPQTDDAHDKEGVRAAQTSPFEFMQRRNRSVTPSGRMWRRGRGKPADKDHASSQRLRQRSPAAFQTSAPRLDVSVQSTRSQSKRSASAGPSARLLKQTTVSRQRRKSQVLEAEPKSPKPATLPSVPPTRLTTPTSTAKVPAIGSPVANPERAAKIATNMLAEVLERKLPLTPASRSSTALNSPIGRSIGIPPDSVDRKYSDTTDNHVRSPVDIPYSVVDTAINRWRLHVRKFEGVATRPVTPPRPSPAEMRASSTDYARLQPVSWAQGTSIDEAVRMRYPGAERSCPATWHLAMDAYIEAMPVYRVQHLQQHAKAFAALKMHMQNRRHERFACHAVQQRIRFNLLVPHLAAWYNLALATVHYHRRLANVTMRSLHDVARSRRIVRGLRLLADEYHRQRCLRAGLQKWLDQAKRNRPVRSLLHAISRRAAMTRLRRYVRAWLALAQGNARTHELTKLADEVRGTFPLRKCLHIWLQAARLRALNRQFRRRNQQMLMVHTFAGWNQISSARRALRVAAARAEAYNRARLLKLAFSFVSEVAREWCIARRADQFRLRCVLDHWRKLTTVGRRQRTAERFLSHRLISLSAIRCIHAWYNITAASKAMARFIAERHRRQLRAMVNAWHHTAHRNLELQLISTAVEANSTTSRLRAILAHWKAQANVHKKLETYISHREHRTVTRFIAAWKQMAAGDRRKKRHLLRRAAEIYRETHQRARVQYFWAWHAAALGRRSLRQALVNAQKRSKRLRLATGWTQWRNFVTTLRNYEQLEELLAMKREVNVARCIVRSWWRRTFRVQIFQAEQRVKRLQKAWFGWQTFLHQRQHAAVRCAQMIQARETIRARRAWDSWEHFIAYKKAKKEMVQSLDRFYRFSSLRITVQHMRQAPYTFARRAAMLRYAQLANARRQISWAMKILLSVFQRKLAILVKRGSTKPRPPSAHLSGPDLRKAIPRPAPGAMLSRLETRLRNRSALSPFETFLDKGMTAPTGSGCFALIYPGGKYVLTSRDTIINPAGKLITAQLLRPHSLSSYFIAASDARDTAAQLKNRLMRLGTVMSANGRVSRSDMGSGHVTGAAAQPNDRAAKVPSLRLQDAVATKAPKRLTLFNSPAKHIPGGARQIFEEPPPIEPLLPIAAPLDEHLIHSDRAKDDDDDDTALLEFERRVLQQAHETQQLATQGRNSSPEHEQDADAAFCPIGIPDDGSDSDKGSVASGVSLSGRRVSVVLDADDLASQLGTGDAHSLSKSLSFSMGGGRAAILSMRRSSTPSAVARRPSLAGSETSNT